MGWKYKPPSGIPAGGSGWGGAAKGSSKGRRKGQPKAASAEWAKQRIRKAQMIRELEQRLWKIAINEQEPTPNQINAAHRLLEHLREVRTDFQAAVAVALQKLGPKALRALTPAQFIRECQRIAAECGFTDEALELATKAAPYFDPRLNSVAVDQVDDKKDVIIRGGLPED